MSDKHCQWSDSGPIKRSMDLRWLFDPVLWFILKWSCWYIFGAGLIGNISWPIRQWPISCVCDCLNLGYAHIVHTVPALPRLLLPCLTASVGDWVDDFGLDLHPLPWGQKIPMIIFAWHRPNHVSCFWLVFKVINSLARCCGGFCIQGSKSGDHWVLDTETGVVWDIILSQKFF